MTADPKINVIVNSLLKATEFRDEANKMVEIQFNDLDLCSKLESRPFSREYIEAVHHSLQAGIDSFFSLQLLGLPDSSNTIGSLDLGRFNVTVNGWATLLRQALESLITSKRLLMCQNWSEASKFGFAYSYKDSVEMVKFLKALRSPMTEEAASRHNELKTFGFQSGLLSRSEGKDEYTLINPIPDVAGLLRNFKLPMKYPKEILKSQGAGIENAEWIYIWLSGFAHGRSWMHATEMTQIEDFEFRVREPDILRFAHAMTYVVILARDCLDLMNMNFSYLAD